MKKTCDNCGTDTFALRRTVIVWDNGDLEHYCVDCYEKDYLGVK